MSGFLDLFEIPRPLVDPALKACRFFNTSLDSLFYDVPTLVRELKLRGLIIGTPQDGLRTAGELDLSALTDPEGSLLVLIRESRPTSASSAMSTCSCTATNLESARSQLRP
jgi:hypothetical protein